MAKGCLFMKNILLVEDDKAVRKQICFSLEKKFTILEAQNRKETVKILKENDIDVVVLDLGLPPSENTPTEGLKLIDIIFEKGPTKIIVLTGQETEKAAVESIKRGVFDYLLKPVKIQKLHYAIERAFIYNKTEKKIEEGGLKKISFNVKTGEGLQPTRETAERSLVLKVLKETDFNVYKTAKILGMKRESIYYFIKKFGWKRDDFG